MPADLLENGFNDWIERSGQNVPDIPSLSPISPQRLPPPSPTLQPPLELTGQELMQRQMQQQMPIGGIGQEQTQQRGAEEDPLVRVIHELYERVRELETKNEKIEGNVKDLQAFTKATLDLISDTHHGDSFMKDHFDRFMELLKENGLPMDEFDEDEKPKDKEAREDIANRLNNIE